MYKKLIVTTQKQRQEVIYKMLETKLVLVTQSCLALCNPIDCGPLDSSVHEISPGKNTGVSSHSLLQVIFLTQGSNPGLLHCRHVLYHLSYQGSWRLKNPRKSDIKSLGNSIQGLFSVKVHIFIKLNKYT